MKKLITLILVSFALMGCFGTEPKNTDSTIVVSFKKSQAQGMAKMVANDEPLQAEYIDTLDLDTLDETIKLTYPVETAQQYNVDVTGAIACNTEVGANVTANVTIDSLEVNTLLTDGGCIIEVDVKTDTLAYAHRMADIGRWDEVREVYGYDLDSSLTYKLLTDTTYYDESQLTYLTFIESPWGITNLYKASFNFVIDTAMYTQIMNDDSLTLRHRHLALKLIDSKYDKQHNFNAYNDVDESFYTSVENFMSQLVNVGLITNIDEGFERITLDESIVRAVSDGEFGGELKVGLSRLVNVQHYLQMQNDL